jgi:hypothetical protein
MAPAPLVQQPEHGKARRAVVIDADARPAEFLIDPSGTVRWRMVTENFFVIARPEQVLEAAKALP